MSPGTYGYGSFGCFLKWWYPQIIHFNRVFHYKPSILGYPYFRKHLFGEGDIVSTFNNELTSVYGLAPLSNNHQYPSPIEFIGCLQSLRWESLKFQWIEGGGPVSLLLKAKPHHFCVVFLFPHFVGRVWRVWNNTNGNLRGPTTPPIPRFPQRNSRHFEGIINHHHPPIRPAIKALFSGGGGIVGTIKFETRHLQKWWHAGLDFEAGSLCFEYAEFSGCRFVSRCFTGFDDFSVIFKIFWCQSHV